MNRYGRPGYGGASKATATTLCQKCLKRGHYSYECKSAAQERPYASRPSRTQQLNNPKLAPKLTNKAPEEFLPKKSILDGKSVDDKRRKRSLHDMDDHRSSRKRSRSNSYSTASVSTISTRSSHSPSPPRHRSRRSPIADEPVASHSRDPPELSHGPSGGGKRRRRTSSRSSVGARQAERDTRFRSVDGLDRNTRMRRSSTSPAARGRRRSRSAQSDERHPGQSPIQSTARNDRRNGNTWRSTPDDRPAARIRAGPGGDQRKHRIETPNGDGEISSMLDAHAIGGKTSNDSVARPRERSLSPYSKRIALTRGVNE